MADQERKTPVDESEQSYNAMSPSQQVTSPSTESSSQRADSDATSKSPTAQSTTSSSLQQTTEQVASQPPQTQQQEATPEPPAMSESVRTLKEAFPETDVVVIEAILESQNNSVERSFEVLLGMSDPNYKPEEPPRPPPADNTQDDIPPPTMPPRPTGDRPTTQAPYGYWQQPEQQQQQQQQQQQSQEPRSVEEQMRMDEEFARQLALQDERDRVQQYRNRQQQQQQDEDDQPLFNFQEDLPVIKEKVIEAGNAAKKKVLDLYNQFKASREQQSTQSQGSSIPTTNAQYRGLPSDEGDDLLAGDVSALRLSDNDVYAQTQPTRGQPQSGVIHVNPPTSGQNKNLSVNDQIRADEELARRLAQEDQFWETSRETNTPQMPPRRTPTSGSPVIGSELEGESVTLSAMPSTQTPPLQKKFEERGEERRSYVIRDEDDSDDDDLVDVDTEVDSEKKENKPHEKSATSPP